MKPVIGLTCQNENLVNRSINRLNYTYINAVVQGGGIPVIIPIMKKTDDIKEYLNILDGIIFTGGEDVSPLYFGEEPLKEVDAICRDRDITEFELFNLAYEKGLPIFGICRGIQLINVALGGNLYQDIYRQVPNVIGHTCGHNVQEGYHTVNILKDSMFYDIYKEEKLVVNSQHHQSIKDLGRNLKVTSTTTDGVIESVESTNDNLIFAVQFHPEAMAMKYDKFIDMFTYFIDKCKK